jgi:beta-lactamase regulating signal transducer with metallopeptidase domain
MSLVELLAHPLARLITLTLLHFLWQGAAIAILLVAVVELWRVRSVQRRYVCSLAALSLMIVLPGATFGWLAAQGADFTAPAVSAQDQRPPRFSAQSVASQDGIVPNTSAWLDTLQPYAFAVWLLGVALLAGRLAAGAVGVWQLRRGLMPLPPEVEVVADRLRRKMGWGSDRSRRVLPLVALSRRVSEAVALGIVRPLVLLPAAWASEMPPAMLEAVIAHELAHLARRDLLVNLLQRIVETLLFYHPAVWWLSRRLRIERELCCDEQAIAVTGRRLEYVQALAHVAQRGTRVELQLAAGIRGEDHMQLLQRVRNVLGASSTPRSTRLWPAGLVAAALPAALWLLTLSFGAAVADEEREGDSPRDGEREERVERETDRRRAERETDRPRVEREVARPDREGERPEKERDNTEAAAAKRARQERARFLGDEEAARRDADRPAKEGPRDGDRPAKKGARDGERPLKEVQRAKPSREAERPVKREVAREFDRDIEDHRVVELSAMVKRLMAENQRLRDELAAARKSGASTEAKRRESKDPAPSKETALHQRKQQLTEAKEAAPGTAARKEILARERKLEALRKEYSAEVDERAAAEKRERASAAKREAMERERAALAERKQAERERAESAERKRADAPRESDEPKKDESKKKPQEEGEE